MRLIMIDNYDSFTFNLAQLFYEFNLEVLVYRHDQIGLDEVAQLNPDWICISPGPKDPAHAGISKDVIRRFAGHVPILGVCLGMQAINEVFGGTTRKAPVPMHGKTCQVHHTGQGIFANLPTPFWAARYHSLRIECPTARSPGVGEQPADFHSDIIPIAIADDQVVMGIQHRKLPVCGVQFHPESFMTEYGIELIDNFLAMNPNYDTADTRALNAHDRFPRLGWLELSPSFAEHSLVGSVQ